MNKNETHNVVLVFECAFDAHWMKDVVQFPNALSQNLFSQKAILIARPNHKQDELARHINLVLFDKEIKENYQQYEKLIFSQFVASPKWYLNACNKAASLGNILVLYPWYGNFGKGAMYFKLKRWIRLKKAKVLLKTDGVLSVQSNTNATFKRRIKDYFKYFFIDKIICENKYFFDKLRKNHSHLISKLVYIPNCPLDIYSQQSLIPYMYRPYNLLFVGRADDPQKGLDILLKIWEQIHDHIAGWKLLIVGSCSAQHKNEIIMRLRKQNAIDNVNWIGVTNPENLCNIYNESRIVICPSREDSGPIVLSEAILSGCAFIGTSVGEIPTVLGNGPGLAKTENDLKDIILEFTLDPSKAETQAKNLYLKMKDRKWSIQIEKFFRKAMFTIS